LTLAFITLAVVYVNSHFDEIRDVLSVSYEKLILLLLLVLIEIMIIGYSTNIILYSFGVRLSFHEWFGLSSANTMANLLLPFRGGIAIRAAYLKKKVNFPITSFLSIVAGTYIIRFMINSLIGMVSLALLFYYYDIFNVPIFVFFASSFVLLSCFIYLSSKLPKFRNGLLARMTSVIEGLQIIGGNRVLLLKLIGLFFLFSVTAFLIIYFSFTALSINITILQATVISCLNSYSALIGITPGAIGISEAVIAFSSRIFDISLTQGILAASLRRGVILLLVFTLGPVYSYVLIDKGLKRYKLGS